MNKYQIVVADNRTKKVIDFIWVNSATLVPVKRAYSALGYKDVGHMNVHSKGRYTAGVEYYKKKGYK